MDGWLAGCGRDMVELGLGALLNKKKFSKIGELKKQRDHLKEQFFHSKKNELKTLTMKLSRTSKK